MPGIRCGPLLGENDFFRNGAVIVMLLQFNENASSEPFNWSRFLGYKGIP